MEPDRYKDIIIRGAADEWVERAAGTPMLYSHDHSKILGTWDKAWLDGDDVKAEGTINKDIMYGPEVMRQIELGILKGVSIGFGSSDYEWNGEGLTFNKININEASIVLFPAHPAAQLTEREEAKAWAIRQLAPPSPDEQLRCELKKLNQRLGRGGKSQ